jgi:Protein of unknown function (DUF4242)
MEDAQAEVEAAARTFLVEHYWPGVTARAFEGAAQKVRASAKQLAGEGVDVEFLHSTLVLEDEAAFCVLRAESESVVEEAYRRAGVRFERVLPAVEMFNPEGSPNKPIGKGK